MGIRFQDGAYCRTDFFFFLGGGRGGNATLRATHY